MPETTDVWLDSDAGRKYARLAAGLRCGALPSVGYRKDDEPDEEPGEPIVESTLQKMADLAKPDLTALLRSSAVSSELEDARGFHKLVLDIDMDAMLVPSTTPNHYHLYINKVMTWATYQEVLKVLAKAGIIEKGYYKASVKRGASWLRTPWTRKTASEQGY